MPAALVVAPCVCSRACVFRCRGAAEASHPLSQGKSQLQRRSIPPPFGKSSLFRGRSQSQLQIPLECTLQSMLLHFLRISAWPMCVWTQFVYSVETNLGGPRALTVCC